MKFASYAALAVLTLSGPSYADADLGPLGTGSFGNFFGSATSVFTDAYTFSLASASTVSGMTGWSGIAGPIGLVVKDSGSMQVADDATPASFSFALGAGSYTLYVTGFGAGAGSFYGGAISAVPVPEPETYALMLAGLGAIGFLVRRRRD